MVTSYKTSLMKLTGKRFIRLGEICGDVIRNVLDSVVNIVQLENSVAELVHQAFSPTTAFCCRSLAAASLALRAIVWPKYFAVSGNANVRITIHATSIPI